MKPPRAAKFALAVYLTACLAACQSTPDADHGVTNASYREALQLVRDKDAALQRRLEASRDEDAALPRAFHGAAWWEAQIAVAREAVNLADATLSGLNAAPVASASR